VNQHHGEDGVSPELTPQLFSKTMKTKFGWIALALLVTVSALCLAHQTAKSAPSSAKAAPASPSLLEKAEQARKTGDLPTAIRLYERAIVAAPDNEKAHNGLRQSVFFSEKNRVKAEAQAASSEKALDELGLMKKSNEAANVRLTAFYRTQMAAHPRVTAYRFYLTLEHAKEGEMKSELEKIAAADPTFAPALSYLAPYAAAAGDVEKERELYRRAAESQPDSDGYAYRYLATFEFGDQKEYRRRVEEYLARYPQSIFATSALSDAAANAETPEDRLAFLERAGNLPGTFYSPNLLALYARTDVHKAAEVAREKLKGAQASKDELSKMWVPELIKIADYYGSIARAHNLLVAGQLVEAQEVIEKAIPPESRNPNTFPKTNLLTEVLLAEGKAPKAYKYLLDDRQTIADSDLTALAVKIGAQLGQAEAQVLDEIVAADIARARQPDDFELEKIAGDGKVKLSDYRGKYVVVTFWHPT